MSHFRAVPFGLGRDTQNKIDGQFSPSDAVRCLEWIKQESGENFEIEENTEEKLKVIDNFYEILKDGMILCKIVNKYLDDDKKLNFNSITFKKSSNLNFEANRERERLDLFLKKCVELGINRGALFQIDNLYECTHLGAVCAGIQALGSEIEARPNFSGTRQWPKKFVDPNAEKRKQKERVESQGCTYKGLLYGAPTE
ncbi:hypothetical protein LOTGIDRAFT_229230 [Lottia gigantea]|uniref:Calponin-homology (CH) domain-containing protein n=1 Tax=Lottia gigantea TaxID=225164 RepID=V3ZWN5_LOTGI|nr:hypothetical protein LOTGIDRAFT_229230 [Lottia gigantea]ESO87025.1 hypothetical protein LOTGIDRAFT_229230 [Lottia gigantea]